MQARYSIVKGTHPASQPIGSTLALGIPLSLKRFFPSTFTLLYCLLCERDLKCLEMPIRDLDGGGWPGGGVGARWLTSKPTQTTCCPVAKHGSTPALSQHTVALQRDPAAMTL